MKRRVPVVVLAHGIAAITGACDRRPAVTTCTDDLRGVWVAQSGERWAVIDYGKTLEAFALFDDASRSGDTSAAPRVIDLSRDPARADALSGEVKRRYARGADHCDARAAVRVTKCEGGELQLVVADPQAPLGYAPCTAPLAAPPHVERWRRE
jgi:hypothetical protein